MAKKVSPKRKTKPAPANPKRRQFTRYAPDAGAIAMIVADGSGKKLEKPLLCLIVEESYAGCGLVTLQNELIQKAGVIEVQVGKLSKMKAEIRWTKSMEDRFIYFGIHYLD